MAISFESFTPPDVSGVLSRLFFSSSWLPGLEALLEAYLCAVDAQRPVGEFALALDELQRLGLSHTALRWLIYKGFALYAADDVGYRAPNHTESKRLILDENGCFVLTEMGFQFVDGVVGHSVL